MKYIVKRVMTIVAAAFMGLALFVLVGLVSLIAGSFFMMNVSPIAASDLDAIPQGATKQDVRAALGPPSRAAEYNDSDGATWTYAHPLLWTMVSIKFDENGRFSEYGIDK